MVYRSVILFIIPLLLSAQVDTAWVRKYNGPSNASDRAEDLVLDKSGNIYVTGTSISYVTADDYATIKYFPNGDTAWVRRYNGPGDETDWATDMAIDTAGNVYITGWSLGLTGGGDYATIKYYPNGDTAWVRRYNAPWNHMDYACAVAVDIPGNVYVTGESQDSTGINDIATIKYFPNGDMVWAKRYSGPAGEDDGARTLAVDNAGYVYVAGYSRFDQLYCANLTIKYDSNGDTVWTRRYGGYWPESAGDIHCDYAGNVYVTGWSFYDYATIKYYPNGDTAWVRRYNGPDNGMDIAKRLVLDDSGNVYVTGYSSGSGTGADIATLKYNPSGSLVWVSRYNGPGNDHDDGSDIVLDNDHCIYVAGCSFGTGTDRDFTTIKYYPNGDTAWIRKYIGAEDGSDLARAIAVNDSGAVYVTGEVWGTASVYSDYMTIKYVPTTGIKEQEVNGPPNGALGFEILPNPANDYFTVRVSRSVGDPAVTIYDICGKKVKEFSGNLQKKEIRVSLTGIDPGVYFVRLNNGSIFKKIIVIE